MALRPTLTDGLPLSRNPLASRGGPVLRETWNVAKVLSSGGVEIFARPRAGLRRWGAGRGPADEGRARPRPRQGAARGGRRAMSEPHDREGRAGRLLRRLRAPDAAARVHA